MVSVCGWPVVGGAPAAGGAAGVLPQSCGAAAPGFCLPGSVAGAEAQPVPPPPVDVGGGAVVVRLGAAGALEGAGVEAWGGGDADGAGADAAGAEGVVGAGGGGAGRSGRSARTWPCGEGRRTPGG